MSPNKGSNRASGVFIAVGVSAGCVLVTLVAVITGDWSWTPVVLSACISFGGVAAWYSGRGRIDKPTIR